MNNKKLPVIDNGKMQALADRLQNLLSSHGESKLIFVDAIIASLKRGDLEQARWFAFESGDKWSSGFEDIQEFIVHELFFDTVDERMNPLGDDL